VDMKVNTVEKFDATEYLESSGLYSAIKTSPLDLGFFSLHWAVVEPSGRQMFWLNPCEQDKYRYGWFTLDQLFAWAGGFGPIVKDRYVKMR